jgi:hypothetical protein
VQWPIPTQTDIQIDEVGMPTVIVRLLRPDLACWAVHQELLGLARVRLSVDQLGLLVRRYQLAAAIVAGSMLFAADDRLSALLVYGRLVLSVGGADNAVSRASIWRDELVANLALSLAALQQGSAEVPAWYQCRFSFTGTKIDDQVWAQMISLAEYRPEAKVQAKREIGGAIVQIATLSTM